MNEDEVVRLTNLLSAAVKFSNITQREVERRLSMSSGSLSRLFSGGIELKVKHILDVCSVIGLAPSGFFKAAYPEPGEETGEAKRLQRLLEQLHPAPANHAEPAAASPAPAPGSGKPALSQVEVEQMVLAALGKFFADLGKAS